ncbi:alpha/beta hydrolase [Zobellia barbeyronii]|uniref:Alpha/beta fold hydrolase n=1 Tax=Zobellia barbeyronii TaxID=2748009 RepID=A0ABS5WGF2_9FLAO|nr:alpha/beta fold hydrolase [Zobellia barbeyronii]MBT2162013.1 alpha/beta fold hydrolase [Zobellia barbeyronii]
MKKIKTISLSILILLAIYAAYLYLSDPYTKALITNNETILFYRPSTEVGDMTDFNFSENTLQVEDSITIHTYIFSPKTNPKANIFLVRGNSGNTSTYADLIKPLVNNGFKVYSTDWRGYGKSTGKPNYRGILKDSEAAFTDFLKHVKNDSIKTVVYGMSLGGQVAVKLTKGNPDKVDALVLDGSLASAYSFIEDNFQGFLMRNFIKDSTAYNQDYVAIRDIADIKNIPKLIIHSTKDRAVPIERGQMIFASAKEPKTFWETNTQHIQTLKDLPDETNQQLSTLLEQ